MSYRERKHSEARKDHFLESKPKILVVCEGENTEPKYLRWFERKCRETRVKCICPKDRGTPKTLVEIAKKLKNEAIDTAKASRDDCLLYEEVWVVCDFDQHPDIEEAIQMARDNQIKLAASNPCFELWIWLHFFDSPGMVGHRDMQSMLKKRQPNYKKQQIFNFNEFFSKSSFTYDLNEAIRRSRRIIKSAESENDPWRNPSTRMHLLCESIRGDSELID